VLHTEDYETRFGAEVREAREARGWSQEALAKQLQEQTGVAIHQSGIARIEAGKRALRFAEAVALARTLMISLGSYLDFPHLTDEEYEEAKKQVAVVDAAVTEAAHQVTDVRNEYHKAEAGRTDAVFGSTVRTRQAIRCHPRVRIAHRPRRRDRSGRHSSVALAGGGAGWGT
jgi:transcriptional regulator with XRE-family HTH domain